ncbi:MAG: serine hydrolase domain-containing protein [Myxococcota bacterium]
MLRGKTFAGLSVAVRWKGAEAARAKGYADLESNAPAHVDTIYPIGSITKQLTAAAVLRLANDGLVQLDALLSAYLPESPAAWRAVRVRHLLNHTSGIPSYTREAKEWQAVSARELAPAQLLSLVTSLPLDFEAGTKFKYSNTGYLLLGLVIERVAKQPYDAYLRQAVLAPAELEQTFACPARRVVPRRAHGYELEGNVLVRARAFSLPNAFAAGDVCSTASDLLRWQAALWSGRVLAPAVVASMLTPARLGDGSLSNYGFGFGLATHRGHTVRFHGGHIYGYRSHLAHYPNDELTVAVLTNSDNGVAAQIESAIAGELLGFDEPRPEMFFD